MKKLVAVVVMIAVVVSVVWFVLKDRDEAEAPYAEAMLEGRRKADIQKVRGDLRAFHQALTSYMTAEGEYPEGDLRTALRVQMPRMPKRDPWGTPFRYERPTPDDYELRSAGPDQEFGTADDIVSRTGSF